MAFDFSKYVGDTQPDTSNTLGALPTGITSQDIPQMFNLQMHPVDNPDDQMIRDTDGNVMGSMKDLNADGYATQKAQWDEQQKLMDSGLLTGPQKIGGAEGGDQQTVSWLGSAAPAQLAGHSDYSPNTPQGTNAGELSRLVYDGTLNDSTGNYDNPLKLINKNSTYDDPNWGKLTYAGNVDHKDGGWDTFWKVAPLLPGLFAGGIGLLAGGLAGAGGATAGAMIGNQTLSDIGGGAIAQGGAATAGSLLANAPAWLTKLFPDLVKTGIKGLASGNGKFDFSKYIPTGLQQIAQNIGH